MTSVSKSKPISSSPGRRKSSGQSHDHARAILLDVQDELHELAAIFAMLPDLHRFADVMDEIINPGPRTRNSRQRSDRATCHDRIGRLLHELPRPQRAAARKALARIADELPEELTLADHMDLTSALNAINTALHYRLKRITAVLAVAR